KGLVYRKGKLSKVLTIANHSMYLSVLFFLIDVKYKIMNITVFMNVNLDGASVKSAFEVVDKIISEENK
ncbi:MAG: hypothetical protein RJQ14_17165, partial [Marinoscillum sp.]